MIQTFTVTNTGTNSSDPLALDFGGDPEFTLINDTCTGLTLAPITGGCSFDLEYTAPPSCTQPTVYSMTVEVNGKALVGPPNTSLWVRL
jgi:hypothetical protein